jgi:hypothetical protein
MSDDDGRPGGPHVIRWRTGELAEISEDGVVIALLTAGAATALALSVLREPPTEAGRELLARTVLWALEEHALRERGAGAAPAPDDKQRTEARLHRKGYRNAVVLGPFAGRGAPEYAVALFDAAGRRQLETRRGTAGELLDWIADLPEQGGTGRE